VISRDPPELVEVRGVIRPGEMLRSGAPRLLAGGAPREAGFDVRGVKVFYDAKTEELVVGGHRAPVALRDGALDVIIFSDRTAIEVFADGGLTYIPLPLDPKAQRQSVVDVFAKGPSGFSGLEMYELKSIWKQ
jgi:fructan beta-fructosidase